jgi:hypothetical protein
MLQRTKYLYIQSTTVYVPSSELELSHPLSPASVPLPPPPQYQRGRAQSPVGEGLGESQFRILEKKLSTLPTLWIHVLYVLQNLYFKQDAQGEGGGDIIVTDCKMQAECMRV